MQTNLRTAIFNAETVAHLKGYEVEILPLVDMAKLFYILLKANNIDIDRHLSNSTELFENLPNYLILDKSSD